MRIADSITHSMGGFEIDTSVIDTTRSTKRDNISLVYTGQLPASMGDVELATVAITIPASLDIHATLVVKVRGKVNPRRYSLQASPEELDSILTAILYHDHTRPDGGGYLSVRKDNGLSRYWNGAIWGMYSAWKCLTLDYNGLLGILKQIPPDRLQRMLQRTLQSIEPEPEA